MRGGKSKLLFMHCFQNKEWEDVNNSTIEIPRGSMTLHKRNWLTSPKKIHKTEIRQEPPRRIQSIEKEPTNHRHIQDPTGKVTGRLADLSQKSYPEIKSQC